MHQKSGASPVANRALHLNFASEMLDVPPHNRQSEPGSPLPGGEEWSKHLVFHRRIDSRTIVFYDNQSEPLGIDLQKLLPRLQHDACSCSSRLERIQNQVQKNLAKNRGGPH